jgi:hypothetical protein
MRRRGLTSATPLPRRNDFARTPLLGLTSGYVQRAAAKLPQQGPLPWRAHDNYFGDLFAFLTSRIDDGTLRFAPKKASPRERTTSRQIRRHSPDTRAE